MREHWNKIVDIFSVGSGLGVTLMPATTFGYITAQDITHTNKDIQRS